MFSKCFGNRCEPKPRKNIFSALPNNVVRSIVPTKAKTVNNVRQMALLAQVSKDLKRIYGPALKNYQIQKKMANYLNSLQYGLFSREPREYTPRVERGNKPWHYSRQLVSKGSPFVTGKTANMAKRITQRNKILKNIKNSNKIINYTKNGMITFTTSNGKKYTYFKADKSLHGMNAGIPKKSITLKMIGIPKSQPM